MKRCISRIRDFLIHLWRTITKYACITIRWKKRTIHISGNIVDAESSEISVNHGDSEATNSMEQNKSSNIEGGIIHDTKSNCILESSRNEEE